LNLGENSPLITMVMHAIAEQNGIDFMAIPYKGSAPALTAMLGGDVEMALDTVPTYMPHIKSGKVRALMSTGRARMPALLEVPTGIEAKSLTSARARCSACGRRLARPMRSSSA
jgi:tripartite-type tricarboxylate transporter receptor subunit TctC